VVTAQRSPVGVRKQTTGITLDLAALSCYTIVTSVAPNLPLIVLGMAAPVQRSAFKLMKVAVWPVEPVVARGLLLQYGGLWFLKEELRFKSRSGKLVQSRRPGMLGAIP
jgi:hypothetical protein